MLMFVAAIAACGSSAAAPLPDAVPLEVFAAPPGMEDVRLSPDGKKIAAKVLIGGEQRLVVTPLAGGQPSIFASGDVDVNWWQWVSDDWLVIGIGNTEAILNQDVYVTRAAGLSADLKTFKPIDWEKSGQFADDVIWMARDGSTRILLSKQTGFMLERDYDASVFEADVATGKAKLHLGARGGSYEWVADGNGTVRLGRAFDTPSKRFSYLYRAPGSAGFVTIPAKDRSGDPVPDPLIFTGPASAIGLHQSDGFDEVYEIALPAFQPGKRLYGVAGYDVDGLHQSLDRSRLDGVSYVTTTERVEWFDPAMKLAQSQIDRAVGPGNGRIESWSRDRSKLIVRVGAPNQAGGMFFWDTEMGSPTLLGWRNKALQARKLSPSKSIRYIARDGTSIEAVLTLPRGREAKSLPLIVLPHGGPAVRDAEGYDWWVQFLAEQGYAVIQPNYRGSSGYGSKFQKLGDGQWGLKMQDDLLDAVSWAAKEGIADARRVCIVGGSYGGYAAMRGAQRDGARYRCAISYAGVSDLKSMMDYDRQFLIGSDPKDYWQSRASDLRAVSPRFHAAEFTVPILLMHGTRDKRVPVKQSRALAEELKRSGKPHLFIEQREGDHHFTREQDRVEFLKAMKAFLDKHNPV